MGIQIADWLMVAAVLTGPIIAVQLTRFIDGQKQTHRRKQSIFKTLMSTRATRLSPHHVEALNMIDLEFMKDNSKEKAVIYAWKGCLDCLRDPSVIQTENGLQRQLDRIVYLLHAMATVLKYDFDKTHIKKRRIFTRRTWRLEMDSQMITQGLIEVLYNKRTIDMHVTYLSDAYESSAESNPEIEVQKT